MITEDYVSFKVAKLLKEKGFDENTLMVYSQNGNFMPDGAIEDTYQVFYAAPTLQMTMKWLREEKKIGIDINTNFSLDGDNKWYYEYGFCIFQLFGTFKTFAQCDYNGYKTYEEACEAGSKYYLENLI